jgi:hypothetical protein
MLEEKKIEMIYIDQKIKTISATQNGWELEG